MANTQRTSVPFVRQTRLVREAEKRRQDKNNPPPKKNTQKYTASIKSRADSAAGLDSSVGIATRYGLDSPLYRLCFIQIRRVLLIQNITILCYLYLS